MGARWQDDPYCTQAASRMGERGLACVELFGVLLLPLCAESDGALRETGRRLAGECAGLISAESFPALRDTALKRAAMKAQSPTLEEVYRECADLPLDTACVAALELESLGDTVVLNPWVAAFLSYCRKKGRGVSFFHRTPYPENRMRKLLEDMGFPILPDEPVYNGLPDDSDVVCLVSDDYDKITFERNTVWYGAPAETGRGLFALEKGLYSDRPGELDALRAVAASAAPQRFQDSGQQVFYRTGAAVLGPVYAMYAEWICDRAKELGVSRVLAFMREGELLAPLIRKSAEHKGLKLEVTLFYTSRKACVLAGVIEPDAGFVGQYLSQRDTLTIGDIFRNLELDIVNSPFYAESGKALRQFSEKLRADLEGYLLSPAAQESLRKTIKERRELLTDYLRAATGGEPALTVDMGAHGTTAACLDRTLKLAGYTGGRLYHLLLYGVAENAEHILNGVYLRGFLGGCGENAGRIRRIDRYFMVLESCCNSGCGSTIGYRRDENGAVIPVLAEPTSTTAENDCRAACWDGIFRFQSLYLALARQMPELATSLMDRRAALTSLLLRLYENPLHGEAMAISSFQYEDQDRSSINSALKTPEGGALLEQADNPEDFIRGRSFAATTYFTWGEAMVEKRYPGYFLNRFLDRRDAPLKRRRRRFFNGDYATKRVFIYGAGKAGRSLAEQAWEVRFPLAGIADKAVCSPGKTLYGYPVMTPEESVGLADIYIITPLSSSGEITALLQGLYQGRDAPEIVLRDDI